MHQIGNELKIVGVSTISMLIESNKKSLVTSTKPKSK